MLNEPSLNGDAKLFFFLGVDASAAVAVVVVVAVLSRRRPNPEVWHCTKNGNRCSCFFHDAARASLHRSGLAVRLGLRLASLAPETRLGGVNAGVEVGGRRASGL